MQPILSIAFFTRSDQLADIYGFMLRNWVLILFVINAILILGFSYTASLDGPLHMARAHLLLQYWNDSIAGTQGFIYDIGRLGHVRPLDLVAVGLLKVASPEVAHQLIIALLVLMLGLACVSLARSFGGQTSPALLLCLPLTFNVLILFGFFNFTLVIALSFIAIAWWNKQKSLSIRSWLSLLLWIVALWWVHRGGPFLFIALLAGHELASWKSSNRKNRERIILICGVVLATLAAILFLFQTRTEATSERNALLDLLTLRPLLMVDQNAEMWFLLVWGALFLAAIVFSIRVRVRSKVLIPSDGLWITAGALILASLVFRTHGAFLVYFVERAQFVALLLLAIWISVTVRNRIIMISIAFISLGIHISRQVFLEEKMAAMGVEHAEVMEAAAHLTPGSIVLTIPANGNWLFQHEAVWLMIDHDGAVLSEKNQYWFAHNNDGPSHLRRTMGGRFYDLRWMQEYLASDTSSLNLEVFLIGPGNTFPNVDPGLLQEILSLNFKEEYTNANASVYRLKESKGRAN